MNQLLQPVTAVKGVGEQTERLLHDMGIHTVSDLLYYFPNRYEDNRLKDLAEVKHKERVTVEGKVYSEPLLTYYGKKRSRLSFRLLVGRYVVTAVCFNRPYYKQKLAINQVVTVSGIWDRNRQTVNVQQIHFGPHKQNQEVEPVYSVRGKLTVSELKRIIRTAIQSYSSFIPENLPEMLRKRYKLPMKEEAVRAMHLPKNADELKQARRRFVYEEFLLFQLKMQAIKHFRRSSSRGISHHFDRKELQSFIDTLPFSLTNAQKRVVSEILSDMSSPYRMNRLLQGDVGSGKTAVAAIVMYAAVLSGYQAALMVPTEILAEQHAKSLSNLFSHTSVRIALLTSSIKGKKRKELLLQLKSGDINMIIGTHSLIQEEVNFCRLGLVITDEQHRFGVNQRRILREKGEFPDVLFMTATPIPRTLAITAFGEMDVSIIDEMPSGRKKVKTYWVRPEMLTRILIFIEKEVKKGHQAYVICPLIEESENLDVENAVTVHSQLTQFYQGRIQIGLLHGRMSQEEKNQVMMDFSENKVQVLVSTTVVEVGVNVPNATVMLVYDAERFGLAQLHQLRGRVGRGNLQSYCILLSDPKSEIGKERMRIMTETDDGFRLAEKDLELRGPGDFFGKKQSGIPEFKIADMVHDYRALETARSDAAKLIQSDAFWKNEQFAPLRDDLEASGVLSGEKLD